MSFRARLFAALILTATLPLAVAMLGVRREMSDRLSAEYGRRVAALVDVIRDGLRRDGTEIASRLEAATAALQRDNAARAALQGDAADRRALLDWAGAAMRVSGLDLLQLQDSAGRIVSSGHFRNAFDQVEPELPQLLGPLGDTVALVRTRTATGPLIALARLDSLRIAGRPYVLVGGIALDAPRLETLARGDELRTELRLPGDTAVTAPSAVAAELALPFIDLESGAPTRGTARLVVAHRDDELVALRRSVDRWFLGVLGLTLLAALLLAAWIAARISRPLRELADKTAAVDLDRLDQDFDSDRADEIGALSRLLGAMTDRLRGSAARLREAERRAAVGDVARQVNHDVKNGLVPIRHVLRHFDQVARDEPGALATVFAERKGTLESSVAYLETLAQRYARLSPGPARQPCDVNAVVRQVAHATASEAVHVALADALPPVSADPVMLRRIVENLVGNAVDSLEQNADATVTIATEATDGGAVPGVRIVVADTGRGMTRAELDRAFDDFYTTKEHGTGLGLSIVRRLVLDLEGSLRVETEPGRGSRFVVELPGVG